MIEGTARGAWWDQHGKMCGIYKGEGEMTWSQGAMRGIRERGSLPLVENDQVAKTTAYFLEEVSGGNESNDQPSDATSRASSLVLLIFGLLGGTLSLLSLISRQSDGVGPAVGGSAVVLLLEDTGLGGGLGLLAGARA